MIEPKPQRAIQIRIGWFRRPGEARGAGQADPGDEPVPGAHRFLDKPGIHAAEPELAAADQPQRAVAVHVAPGEKYPTLIRVVELGGL